MIGAPLNAEQLAAYLARIGLSGPLAPDVACLHRIHAAHVRTIPFENLDVQLGDPPSLKPDTIFAKLVERRRGGWCYEHNGLLGRALAAIGFPVTRLAAGVVRPTGEVLAGSHLALKVEAQGLWLVDGGFGSWIAAPLPLAPGAHDLAPWPVRLDRIEDGRWRLERGGAAPAMAYVFADEPAEEDLLARTCAWQAHDPASVFVQNLVAQRLDGATDWTLRGRVLTRTTGAEAERRLLADADELVAVLRDRFGLDVPQVADVWGAIAARHAALFA